MQPDRRPAVLAVALALVVVVGVLTVVFVRDRLGSGGTETPLAARADLAGQTYVVGGKNISDEQDILCEATVAALESVRAQVTDRCGTGSTDVTRRALLRGDIDVYWEYTGTAWASFFAETARIPDDDRLYQAVRQRDLAQNQLVWMDRARFDDTYAFAMSGAVSKELGITSLSGMAAHITAGKPGAMCVETEYRGRDDGLRGLQRTYRFAPRPDQLETLGSSEIYQSVADGGCLFGEVYTTDARIQDLGLTVLTDDRNWHPTYNPAPVMRQDAFDRDPAVAGVLAPIAQALDHRTILELNHQVSSQGRTAHDVARGWLSDRGFIAGS